MTKNFEIGYARVSREDQNLDMQLQAIIKRGVDKKQIFQEKVSGVSKKRPQFDLCLKRLRRGDTLVVWKLDRLGRSLKQLYELSADLDRRGIMLVSLTEGIDTTTAMGVLFFHIMASIAQFERDLISERTKAGIAAAKERKSWRSRPVHFDKENYETAVSFYSGQLKQNKDVTINMVAAKSGLTKAQVNKHWDKIQAGVPWQWGTNTLKNKKRLKRYHTNKKDEKKCQS